MSEIDKLKQLKDAGQVHFMARKIDVDFPKLIAEIDRLTARNAELVEAVKALLEVEFVGDDADECPWCHNAWHNPDDDCPRQRAAALVEGEK